jgi:uncharacterized phage protein (TIGR01671 family)
MNREILFKGKRIDTGEWVYGYYVFQRKRTGGFGQQLTEHDHDRHLICSSKLGQCAEVDATTVCQYIGRNDKNGKRIFSGDLVKLCDTNPVIFRVEVILARYGYKTVYIDIDNGKVAENYFLEKCEVVGNIFNPELLEVEK